jgi:predicted NBD/HSP70 family sugar kinase
MSLPHSIVRQVLTEPKSLANLQQATQVSLPTLRRAVHDLTEARWIRVVGQAATRGGRPAMLYGLDSSRFLLVGVHLQLPGMRLITSDLGGKVLDEEKIFDQVVPTSREAVLAVVDYVTRIRAASSDQVILGMGIASPGFTDPATGDIISIGRVPTWESFPICRRLEAALDMPVQIANDVDCMAFAEFLHGSESLEENLAYVGYDEGVKVSLFLRGELYRGALGNAGLIAGRLLRIDNRYEHEDVHGLLTVNGVNRRFERRVAAVDVADRPPYAHILGIANPRERFRLILSCEDSTTPICQEIVRDLNTALAAAVANVIFIVQPDVIVIGGLLSAMSSAQFEALEASIRSHLPPLISHSAIIRQGKLASRNAAAIGANHHFVQVYLNDPSSSLSTLIS